MLSLLASLSKPLLYIGIFFFFSLDTYSMKEKPYHHLPDGSFRNPEGSPKRDPNLKWSYKIFNEERKKIKLDIPEDHVIPRQKVLEDLEVNKKNDYIAWIGHATFLT